MGSFHVEPKFIPGLLAGADLSAAAKRYCALQIETAGTVNISGTSEAEFIGFLQDTPASGAPAEIAGAFGGSKARAAGTITPGQFLKTNSSGHLLAIGAFETARAVAYALEGAVSGDIFSVLVLEPTLISGTSAIGPSYANFTVTLAQVNAGLTLLPVVAGKSVILHSFTAMPNGSFATGTAIVLEDTTTGTDFVSLAQAQLTDNAILMPGITGVTLGAAMGDGGAAGEGLRIVKTGSDFATATGINVKLVYSYV